MAGKHQTGNAYLGTMGAQLMASLKPLNTIVLCCLGGFQGGPHLGPNDTDSRQSLGQLHV